MAISMMGSAGPSSSSSSWMAAGGGGGGGGSSLKGRSRGRVRCAASAAPGGTLMDQYKTLRIQPGASEKEVKKAFRQLALQYHPDVCKGRDCGVRFHQINEAYDIVMSALRAGEEAEQQQAAWGSEEEEEEGVYGGGEAGWDLWEEWMGWEGAGIRDYTSHINPYI